MIIGLVGPVDSDLQTVSDLLLYDHDIQVVDGMSVIRQMDRTHVNNLITNESYKKVILKQLETEFGTFIITGNVLLSIDVCQWLINTGNVVCVVSRAALEDYDSDVIDMSGVYWGDENIQRYELETRFKDFYDKLQGEDINLYQLDLSDEDSEDLVRLVEQSQVWDFSTCKTGAASDEIVSLLCGRDGVDMSIQDSIKNAMKELGIELDTDESLEEPMEKSVKPKKVQKTVDKPQKESKMEKAQMTLFDVETESEPELVEEVESEANESESIFVKFTDDTMALLIPKDVTLEDQTISGIEFNVLTVALPDITSRKLQELQAISDKPQPVKKTVVRKPIENQKKSSKKPKPAPVQVSSQSDDLDELKSQKAELDAEIKNYRAEGDMDTVNALRKQRRAIRNKINKLLN